jgi:hypothetical protein
MSPDSKNHWTLRYPLFSSCVGIVPVKPQGQGHEKEGCEFCIHITYNLYPLAPLYFPFRSWHQEQRIGPRDNANTHFGVFADMFFKEVCFPL